MHSLKWPWERQHRMGIPTDYKDVVKYVKEWKIDIIHTHTSIVLGYVGNIIADLHNIPNVTTYHTMMVEYMHYVPFIEPLLKVYIKGENKRFCNKNRAVIAPSIKIKKLLLDYGVTVPVEVVPNGVDLAPFKHEYQAAEIEDFGSEYGIGRDDKLIIFVGRLGEEKSIDKIMENLSKTERLCQNPRSWRQGPFYRIPEVAVRNLSCLSQQRYVHNSIPHRDFWAGDP